MTRRGFLAAAGSALAAPYILTSDALGAGTKLPASEQLQIGHVGVNWMGGIHLTSYRDGKPYPGARTVALCDCDQRHLDHWMKVFGGKPKRYTDFRRFLDDPDIDAVLSAVPDHWHAIVAIHAAQAGKDIYSEKPLSLTIGQGRAMADAVRRYGRVFQTGSQQRSSGNFRLACELVRSGRIGKVQTVHVGVGGPSGPCYLPAQPVPAGLDWDMWLGPAPWRPYHASIHPVKWRAFRDYSGGSMTDWGAHHFDIAQWGLGMDGSGPVEIHPPDGKDHDTLTYKYANGVAMFRGGANGVLFTGTDGKIEVNRGRLSSDPPEIIKEPIGPSDVHLARSPAGSWRGHNLDWHHCIRTRQRPICDVEIGHRSITVCHLGNIAVWLKRSLKWDPATERCIGDDEANRWLDRPQRAPWHL